jgi:hypothetical protein
MTVLSIYPLNHNKIFTIEEAQELAPLLNIITVDTRINLEKLNSQLLFFKKNNRKTVEIQEQINSVLENWSNKIRRLGARPVSLGKVRIQGERKIYLWENNELRSH